MNCAHCSTPMTGRKRKYCDAKCRRSADAKVRYELVASPDAQCVEPRCTRHKYIRGRCAMHHKRTIARPPDKMVAAYCAVCGTPVLRMPRPTKLGRTCSTQCRKILTFGIGTTCPLPRDHMARWFGKTCEWKPPRPKPVPAIQRTISCEWCGAAKTTKSSATRFCTKSCKRKSTAARRRANEFNAPGLYTWQQIVQLWSAFDKRCAYCQAPTPLTQIQAEHVHPLSKHGRNDIGNLLPSCSACNSDKRDLLLVDWNPDRLRRGLQPVATTWNATDVRYTHLVTHSSTLRLAA